MSMYSIALSGANANRTSLNVTAQNIANADTVGYSRQQATRSSISGANGLAGVEVSSIRRVADEFLISQLSASNTVLGESDYTASSLSQLENIIGADGFNLSAGLTQFFAGISEATTAPESNVFRQQVLSDGQALTQRFNGLSNAITAQQQQLSNDREMTVSDTNGLLENIATSSKAIMNIKGSGGDTATLEDERDLMISELAKVFTVNVDKDSNGQLQLSMANGQPLLINASVATLSTKSLDGEPYQAALEVNFNGQKFPLGDNIGGELGAMQNAQKNDLQPILASLDAMAEIISKEVNGALADGFDLNGKSGEPLFAYEGGSLTINPLIQANQLAFSSDGALGNGDVLNKISALSSTDFSELGNITLSEAFSAITGKIAIDSRQAQADLASNTGLFNQIQASRDNLSGVNSDEEAANLMTYANAYEANMKVISTANQMFNTIISAF